MTNIKEVIEIALNNGFRVKRYEILEVSLDKDYTIMVEYFDTLLNRHDKVEFVF